MRNKRNKQTKWQKYFIPEISYNKFSFSDFAKKFFNLIYSIEAKHNIESLLTDFNPKLVHLHTIYHHISPSILAEFKKRNLPIVQSIGEYHLISPNYNLFHDSEICEITKSNRFYKAVLHKCVKDSYLASIAEVIEKYIHYFIGWERNYVDYFLARSKFLQNKLIEFGLQTKKIIHLPHFIDYQQYKPNFGQGAYILYFGRLSPEKGINYLLEAMKLLPKIKLVIAGRGSQEKELRILNQELGNKNVEFLGFKDGAELKRLIANSRFTILPSVWYEVFGLSILESFATGKPVIASDIGGIPETVKNGFNGFLAKPGNVDDLADKISKLWSDPVLCRKIGRNAREYVEKNFGPEEHYEKLVGIYNKAIKLHT